MDVIRSTSLGQKLRIFFKSKFIVAISIVLLTSGMFLGVTKASGAENVDISTVYQYFLLYNKDISNEGKKGVVADKVQGIVGSGGNQLDFGYADIVNEAPKDSKSAAKKFVTAMATLSQYNYISTTTNGIPSLLTRALRAIIGIVLFVFGFVFDMSQLLLSPIVEIFASLNIIPLLANIFSESEAGNTISTKLGITPENLKNFLSITITIFILVILANFIWLLRKGGSEIDGSEAKKFKNRFVGFITIPMVLICGSTLMSELSTFTRDNTVVGGYSKWLLDVKSYAYKKNFSLAEIGADDINGKQSEGYIDASYNPYSGSKLDTISQSINNISNFKGKFQNTQLAMAYLSSSVFDGWDYLAYEKSAQSAEDNAVGSIYARLNGVNGVSKFDPKNLENFSEGYTSTGIRMSDWDKTGDGTPINKVEEDYIEDKKVVVSDYKIWEDRYIYGAKRTGNISDYYKVKPSWEQIYAKLGGGGNFQLSDASMFYVLNTEFTGKGGSFYLDGPANGMYANIAKFDSQRPIYYDVSMVGTPLFTIPAMLSAPIFTIIVTLASILAFLEIGLLDMNLKPARAYVKVATLGNIEYTIACSMYILGILVTVVTFTIVPPILTTILQFSGSMFGNLLTNNQNGPQKSVSMITGISEILVFVIALIFAWAFFKIPSFRNKLTNAMMIPWQWANQKGQALEDSVDGASAKDLMETTENQRNSKQQRWNALTSAGEQIAKGYTVDPKTGRKHKASSFEQAIARNFLKGSVVAGRYTPADADSNHSAVENSLAYIEQLGKAERIDNALHKQLNDDTIEQTLKDSGLDIKTQKEALSEDNLYNDDGSMKTDVVGLSQNDRVIRDNFNNEKELMDQDRNDLINGLSEFDKQDIKERLTELETLQANGVPLSEHEERELGRLQERLENDSLHDNLSDSERSLESLKGDMAVEDMQERYNALSNTPVDKLTDDQLVEKDGLKDRLDIENNKEKIASEQNTIDDLEMKKKTLDPNKAFDRRQINNINKEVADRTNTIKQLQADSDAASLRLERRIDKQKQGIDQVRQQIKDKQQNISARNNDLYQREQQYVNDIKKRLQTPDGRLLTQEEQTDNIKNIIKQTQANVQQFRDQSNGQSAQQLLDSINQMEQIAKNMGASNPSQVFGDDFNLEGIKQDAQSIINTMPIENMNKSTSLRSGGADLNGDGVMDETTFERYGQHINTDNIANVGASRDPKFYRENNKNRF